MRGVENIKRPKRKSDHNGQLVLCFVEKIQRPEVSFRIESRATRSTRTLLYIFFFFLTLKNFVKVAYRDLSFSKNESLRIYWYYIQIDVQRSIVAFPLPPSVNF